MKGTMTWPSSRLYILTLMFFSANATLNVFISLRGHDLGAMSTVIGIVMGACMLAAMVFRPWVGQIIARISPIKVLRIILIINTVALIIYGLTSLRGYFVARVMQGARMAFFPMSLQLDTISALLEEHCSGGISLYSLFPTIPNLIRPLVVVSIWNANNIPLFAIVIIFIVLTTTFFGYRVTSAEQEPDTSDKIGKMPFNAVIVSAQFFKNKELLNSGIIMIVASIVLGTVSIFAPLYIVSLGFVNAGVFLIIRAIAVVAARLCLRKCILSDDMWHPKYIVSVLSLLVTASFVVAFDPRVGVIIFYGSTILIGMMQAMVYPILTSYLSFVLPKVGRNMLLGLFIVCAGLGISLGDALMGPISDLVGFKWMYLIYGMLVTVIIIMSFLKKPTPRPTSGL